MAGYDRASLGECKKAGRRWYRACHDACAGLSCERAARWLSSRCFRSAASSRSVIARSSACSFSFSCVSLSTLLARFCTFCILE